MKKMNLKSACAIVKKAVAKRSPELLIGIGIAGMIGTTINAVRTTPKAVRLIEQKKKELKKDKLSPVETIKATWTCYLPSVISGTLSVACILGGNSINARRNAALATAYTLSETAFKEYKEKVVETIGEKQEHVIRDAVVKEHVEKDPVASKEVFITGKGKTLFYDMLSGRYFESDIEQVRRSVNDMNHRLMSEMYLSLNDFYYEIGLKPTVLGNELGWNVSEGLIEPNYSPQIADDGRPCIAIDYCVAPRYNFSQLM